MSVTVETLENLERKVVLSLPWSEINAETDKKLKQTQRRAKIDGFRPGKAPLKMIAQMYGASAQNDVINELVQRRFHDVAVAQELKVAGFPRFEGVEEQDDKESFKVAAIFEVFPEVVIGDLSAQEVEKVTASVGDAEVDQTVEILRKQRTRFNHVEREARNGDRVIIDFEGKIDGEPFAGGASKNYAFVLGASQMLPEFEAGVVGMKAGESKDVTVNFPEDYHGKDVAGKTAVFTITLNNVSEATLPEVDADFAKALGIADGDVAKMREEVQKNVSREVERRVNEQTKESVMNALLKAVELKAPVALVNEEAARLANEMKQNFVNQGMADAANLDLPLDMFKEQAERRVSLGLILAKLVDENKLEPTEEQIKAVVANFAESYEDPQEVIDWYYADPSRLQAPTSLAVESNVVDFVLGKAKVNEKALSFDEVMGAQA
ncbi:TPA: trigger factor [Neisseria meningitidis]|uniref:Trigger factor n=1 Tax=Neisseria meningitidis serogroup C (strain 053442) TaxID=374833 RepID=TIG_NEIM0|nr:trigger factor [Neisseria meningitidis]A9LZP0.1 RecName: Full=Trigger factor; Short=TF; AltName: Full=PPIase [Neisseria meningitidis 053442]ABX73398.1 trigger factor [Neisseria meningitidis 053442]MCL4975808.1 trigger factor [Neisseria meningitidis]MCL4981576.1 trigger factor [Neisseria meningitidis]MCL4985685.1 trigger factor [Neisseria meningitidis]MCL5001985.1 trigger factor [Neisseria meningitidis]